jgi:hypothetical protein
MKRLLLQHLASSLSTLYKFMQNRYKTGQNTYVKAMTLMFFGFVTEITFFFLFRKLAIEFIASSLLCVNIFFLKLKGNGSKFEKR